MIDHHRLPVVFFRSTSDREPVREWLRKLSAGERRKIGEEIKTVQFGWPIGMPLVRKLEPGLWEIRVDLPGKIARVLFTVHEGAAVLLHGFIKKSQKTHSPDLEVAKKRLSQLKGKTSGGSGK